MDPIPDQHIDTFTQAQIQPLSRQTLAKRALLQESWRSIDVEQTPAEMRLRLQVIAETYPEEGGKALARFDSLEKRVRELEHTPEPPWLTMLLDGTSIEGVSVELLPTALLVRIPKEQFHRMSPNSQGYVSRWHELPDDLAGRAILIPDPPHASKRDVLRHEIIHVLEDKKVPLEPVQVIADLCGSRGADRSAASEYIQMMGVEPRMRAFSEVVAYIGSGKKPDSIESYGVRELSDALQTLLKSLALGQDLSRADKKVLFERAADVYRHHVLYAEALQLQFEKCVERLGNEVAVARWLAHGPDEIDMSMVSEKGSQLATKFRSLLDGVTDNDDMEQWSGPAWRGAIRELSLYPHPAVLPHVVEAIGRTCSAALLVRLLEAAEICIQLEPARAAAITWGEALQKLALIATRSDPSQHYVTAARSFLSGCTSGWLFLKPFDGVSTHPYEQIGAALQPSVQPAELETLLSKTYPSRHPIWREIPLGWVIEKTDGLQPMAKTSLLLAIAEHCSNEFDVTEALSLLAFMAEAGIMPQCYLSELRRVAHGVWQNREYQGYRARNKDKCEEALDKIQKVVGGYAGEVAAKDALDPSV